MSSNFGLHPRLCECFLVEGKKCISVHSPEYSVVGFFVCVYFVHSLRLLSKRDSLLGTFYDLAKVEFLMCIFVF